MPGPRHAGFSLVEVIVAVLIVGGLFVVALNAVSASLAGRHQFSNQARGTALAQGLMAEVLRQHYEHPGAGGVFGPEPGEADAPGRTGFNDVDDYQGWSASPPQHRDGTAIAGAEAFARSVLVEWVRGEDLDAVSTSETGAKRITVTVTHRGKRVAQLVAVRTRAVSHVAAN